MELDGDLRWVREQLDMLDHARLDSPLDPTEESRHRDLCSLERLMLALAA
jgi:hypothetical protein